MRRRSFAVALRRSRELARLVVTRFAQDRCLQVAGDLTFTTLLALVPMFTIALSLFAAFPVFEEWSNAFKVFLLTTLVPEVSGKVITVYMQQFADNAAKLTAVGIVFLAVTALMLLASIEREFNAIWRARRPRTLVQRLVIYWTFITIGPLLLGASLSLTSWLVTLSLQSVDGLDSTQQFALKGLPVLLNAAAFALLYLMIPNRRVAVKDALAGGLLAAIGFEAMKRGFGLYVQLFPTYDLIYGTFATIPIFLLWLYLSWLVVLVAAVVVAVLPRWRLGFAQGERADGGPLFHALQLLELLHRARSRGEAPTIAQLVARSGIAEEEVEQLLEAMNGAGWARRVQPAGWVLAQDLSAVRLLEVYRLFAVPAHQAAATPNGLLDGAGKRLAEAEEKLDVPLAALLPEPSGFSAEATSSQKPQVTTDSAPSMRSGSPQVGSGDPPL